MAINKKINPTAVFFWAAALLCMGFIFYMSAQPADESDRMSSAVIEWLESVFGAQFTSFLVRKLAHFLEFAFLSFLLNFAFYFTRKKRPAYLWATLAASLYAATDEIHQLFVPGRACQLRDWAIDSAGAVFGAVCVFAVLFIARRIQKRKQIRGLER